MLSRDNPALFFLVLLIAVTACLGIALLRSGSVAAWKVKRTEEKERKQEEKEAALKAKKEAEQRAAEEQYRKLQLEINPYESYPTFSVKLDATGKRGVAAEPKEMVEEHIIADHFYDISGHHRSVEKWFVQKEKEIEEMPDWLKETRRRQLNTARWYADRYQFDIIKKHKRTRTVNYIKQTWYQEETLCSVSYTFSQLSRMNDELQKIGYTCTTRRNAIMGQRALMTKELKQKIFKRDDYTCQRCGYRDPTCNGLHIDHIKPVSKGGLTVASNLQVLCRTCNLKKSNKT